MQCDDSVVPPSEKEEVKKRVLDTIDQKDMGPMYKLLCKKFEWKLDETRLENLEKRNASKLKEMDAKYADAVENLGEDEVLDFALAKANYLSSIGDKEKMVAAFEVVKEKSFSSGKKIDASFHLMRNAFLHSDMDIMKDSLEASKTLVEEGGDWDRRNRRRVYEGVYKLSQRDVSRSSELFLGSVATFTCFELLSYETLVAYTVLTGMISLDRATLKEKVVTNSDVLSTIGKIPHLSELLNAFYECRYRDFFKAMVDIYPYMRRDRVLSRHASFFIREMRILAYKQLLQSYQSVTLVSMAETFGVTISFLDQELSRFIGSGRLAAKIDKVAGIIVTNRPDVKNAQYHDLIKQGDALLNQIHRLTRTIRM